MSPRSRFTAAAVLIVVAVLWPGIPLLAAANGVELTGRTKSGTMLFASLAFIVMAVVFVITGLRDVIRARRRARRGEGR